MNEIIFDNPTKDKPENIFTAEILKQLAEMAQKIIEIKKDKKIDYDFLEKLLFCYCRNNDFINKKNEEKFFKKWEIISIVLDYYKSIDPELYENVKRIIFGRRPNIRINIYGSSEVEDFNEKDFEFKGFKKYSKSHENYFKNNKDIIYIPLESNKDRVIQEKDEGTMFNLYALTHELAHTFDGILDEIIDKNIEYIINYDIEVSGLFNESIARAFEFNLKPYLLQNGIIKSKDETLKTERFLHNFTFKEALITYLKLKFAKVFEEKGKITVEDADNVFNNLDYFHPNAKRVYTSDMIKENNNPRYENEFFRDFGYGISGMITPTIMEYIKNGKIEELKEFFRLSKAGYFAKTLETLNIPLNDEGIRILKENMLKYTGTLKEEEQEHEK